MLPILFLHDLLSRLELIFDTAQQPLVPHVRIYLLIESIELRFALLVAHEVRLEAELDDLGQFRVLEACRLAWVAWDSGGSHMLPEISLNLQRFHDLHGACRLVVSSVLSIVHLKVDLVDERPKAAVTNQQSKCVRAHPDCEEFKDSDRAQFLQLVQSLTAYSLLQAVVGVGSHDHSGNSLVDSLGKPKFIDLFVA